MSTAYLVFVVIERERSEFQISTIKRRRQALALSLSRLLPRRRANMLPSWGLKRGLRCQEFECRIGLAEFGEELVVFEVIAVPVLSVNAFSVRLGSKKISIESQLSSTHAAEQDKADFASHIIETRRIAPQRSAPQ